MLIENDLFLSLHFLSSIKLFNLTDDNERTAFLQEVQMKLALKKSTEATEAGVCLVWAFLIMSGGHIMKRSNVSKNQLLIIARFFQVNLTQPEGWGEGFLGAIGLKKDDQTNKKKILLRCFSCAIFALFVAPGSQTLATATEFDNAMTELRSTLSNKKYGDVRLEGMQAMSLIESRKDSMLDQLNDTITKILKMFYHESFLNSIEFFYHW
jgi:ectopic P granules protein 5